jgi:hypothetical protein
MCAARVAALLLLLACGPTFAQLLPSSPENNEPHADEWPAKMGAGFLGEAATTTIVSFAVLEAASASHVDWMELSSLAWGAAWGLSLAFIVPAGTMFGVKLVGDRHDEDGSLGTSYGGALVGTIGGLVLGTIGTADLGTRKEARGVALCVVAALLPPVGATLSYNLTASGMPPVGLTRVLPPFVTMTRQSRSDGYRVAGVSVRLLTVRF